MQSYLGKANLGTRVNPVITANLFRPDRLGNQYITAIPDKLGNNRFISIRVGIAIPAARAFHYHLGPTVLGNSLGLTILGNSLNPTCPGPIPHKVAIHCRVRMLGIRPMHTTSITPLHPGCITSPKRPTILECELENDPTVSTCSWQAQDWVRCFW